MPTSDHLSSLLETRAQVSFKRHIFSADVAVQTDNILLNGSTSLNGSYEPLKSDFSMNEDDEISKLTATDLGAILKWSKEISSDINLSMALQRLTEIATGMHFPAF